MPLYQLITDKVVSFPYHIHVINITSLPYRTSYETGKQVISLLPTLSEKQGETHVFLLNSNTEVMVVNNIIYIR